MFVGCIVLLVISMGFGWFQYIRVAHAGFWDELQFPLFAFEECSAQPLTDTHKMFHDVSMLSYVSIGASL